ncbi:hypothetical protein PYCC9005_000472 [Savitreella phatthalungensis]
MYAAVVRQSSNKRRRCSSDDAGHGDRDRRRSGLRRESSASALPSSTTTTRSTAIGTSQADEPMLEVSRLHITPRSSDPPYQTPALDDGSVDVARSSSSSFGLIGDSHGVDGMLIDRDELLTKASSPPLHPPGAHTSLKLPIGYGYGHDRGDVGVDGGMMVDGDDGTTCAEDGDGGAGRVARGRLVMGYRRDCPLCIARAPGHYNHWVATTPIRAGAPTSHASGTTRNTMS